MTATPDRASPRSGRPAAEGLNAVYPGIERSPGQLNTLLLGLVGHEIGRLLTDNPEQMDIARRAAVRIVLGHAPADDADLMVTARMVALGVASLRTLGLAMRADTVTAEGLRLLNCAASLNRAGASLRQRRAARDRASPARA